jgi:hypothetical protein
LNDPQSLHNYLYTHADPVNGIDPSGKFSLGSMGVAMVSGAKIGATIGAVGGSLYGMYTGHQRTGSIFTIDIIKYGFLGALTDASAGAAIGGASWLISNQVFIQSLRVGFPKAIGKFWGKEHKVTRTMFFVGLVLGLPCGVFENEIFGFMGIENTTFWDLAVTQGIILPSTLLSLAQVTAVRETIVAKALEQNGSVKTAVTHAMRNGRNKLGYVKYKYVERMGYITNTAKGAFTWTGAFIAGFAIGFDVGKLTRNVFISDDNN